MEVQINSLQGLERVMGQDESFELAIKRSVWNDYVRKHIVADLKAEQEQCVKRQLNDTFEEELQRWVNESLKPTIKEHPRYQALVTDVARRLIRSEVELFLKEHLDAILKAQGEQLIRNAAEVSLKIMRSKMEDQFNNAMQSLVDIVKNNLKDKAQ